MQKLYYPTLYILAVGCAIVFYDQHITARFVVSAIIVYFWQLSIYSRLKDQKIRRAVKIFDVVLCLLIDLTMICAVVYFRYFSVKFLLSGTVLFLVLLISNYFIVRWWRKI